MTLFQGYNTVNKLLGSIVVSIPACHAGDRGSIPRRGGCFVYYRFFGLIYNTHIFCFFIKVLILSKTALYVISFSC